MQYLKGFGLQGPGPSFVEASRMTPGELALWKVLKSHPEMPGWESQWRDKYYTLDFYNPGARLSIEVDGYQHWKEKRMAFDRRRTAYLRRTYHLEELRYTNMQVFERMEYLLKEILEAYQAGIRCATERDIDWYRRIGSSIQ